MLRIILSLIFPLVFCLTSISYSQDTISAKYFPLNVGNVWVYRVTFWPIPFPPIINKYQIFKDTIINLKKYFFYGDGAFLSTNWIRYDSVSGNLLAYSSDGGCSSFPDDKIIDSLSSVQGSQIFCQYQYTYSRECSGEGSITLFNNYITQTKEFVHDGLLYENFTYAKNFGIVESCSGEPPPCTGFSNLKGCVINGIVYGDTTLTIIKQTSSIIPEKFSLNQNYPNPFNPNTVLNYSLPGTQYSILKVFDALGKEITTLVNEMQNAGSYSVEFDGSNLSSGIYFYKLESEKFSETKRMVLLK